MTTDQRRELLITIVRQTVSALADGEQEEFIPTLTVFTDAEVNLHSMVDGIQPDEVPIEQVERFAFEVWEAGRAFEHVFFAAESCSESGEPEIMISGMCDGAEPVIAYVKCERVPNDALISTNNISVCVEMDSSLDRFPAAAAMRGLQRRSAA